jgi:hypothetical protein
MDQRGFERLMQAVARGWSTGDAAGAAGCFTDDVVYVEPPDRQRYVGQDALYELSGGADPPPMSMTWHHLVFDPGRGIGAGEYTFRGNRQYHGAVMVQVRDGRIARWREYQYASDLAWPDFVGDSRFSPPA